MPSIFVEEYRKEMSLTGYPFAACMPLQTDTGYILPIGTIADASIYCENVLKLPVFTAVEKNEGTVTFTVGAYSASFDLPVQDEVLTFFTENKVFGGIFVVDKERIRTLGGWKDGRHTFVSPLAFCPRCIEVVPAAGVQRLITDDNKIYSGDIVISGGLGTTLQLLVSDSKVTHIEVNCVGDPTYGVDPKSAVVPIQRVVCTDKLKATVELVGNEMGAVAMLAGDIYDSFLTDEPSIPAAEALRIEGYGDTVRVSLGGK